MGFEFLRGMKSIESHQQHIHFQMAEYRISIYGRKESEWDQLASWIVTNKLQSENVTWLIQVQLPSPMSLFLPF